MDASCGDKAGHLCWGDAVIVGGELVDDGQEPRNELRGLIVTLVSNGMVEQQAASCAAVGTMVATYRDLQGTRVFGQENEPVLVIPAWVEQLEQALPVDHTVVVDLMLVNIPLGLSVAVWRAHRGACVLYQVDTVGARDGDVLEPNALGCAKGSWVVEFNHGVQYLVVESMRVVGVQRQTLRSGAMILTV